MRRIAALAVLIAFLGGCAPAEVAPPTPSATTAPTPTPTAEPLLGPVAPVGAPTALIGGLTVPWSVVRLESGSVLISERSRGVVRELTSDGELRDMATIAGVVPYGEGGLLGLAVLGEKFLYAYFTAESDNRIMRFAIDGEPGSYSLGAGEVILAGLAKAGNHDGGRIAFGPDGMLYAAVGDAGVPSRAQDPASLNGKILRMTPFGGVPSDNPFGTLVYSMGHRNPQGITWDDEGQLWAAELGANTWDEFNRIEAGANYGWPVVEGIGGVEGYVDPVLQWDTDDASPSGLTYYRGTFFLGALRGQRLWVITVTGTTATSVPYFVNEYGRIRCVLPGPDGTLWFTTTNTDVNGTPGPDGDHLWQVNLDVVTAG